VCGSSSTPGSSSGSATSSGLKAAKTSMGTVLTNAKGFTLYWFSLDNLGHVEMQRGMRVRMAAGGWPGQRRIWRVAFRQARHHHTLRWFQPGDLQRSSPPLYTFSGDSGPGKTGGNGISGFGGTWHTVTTDAA
jgi:predicted lipoprotein with Yx(FWY)xxD motif